MPFYRFLVHGRDTSQPEDTKGFLTTRYAYGVSEEKAAEKVLAHLMAEFTKGVSASIWGAGPPLLNIEKADRIGLHQLHSAPNKGSTF